MLSKLKKTATIITTGALLALGATVTSNALPQGSVGGPEAAQAATAGCVANIKYTYLGYSSYGRPVYKKTCTYRTSLGVLIYNYDAGQYVKNDSGQWYRLS